VRRTSQISDELTFKLGAQLEVFWSFNLGSDALTRAMTILLRLLGGGILCVFAYVPAWIGYDAVADAIANPRTIDATWFIAIVICSALTYFLLLLAYRAFTGHGRKEDGGLLPPLAIQGFAVAFSGIGAAVSAFGLYAGHWGAVCGGLFEFLTGVSVFQLANV
jgi:hypothetical protein